MKIDTKFKTKLMKYMRSTDSETELIMFQNYDANRNRYYHVHIKNMSKLILTIKENTERFLHVNKIRFCIALNDPNKCVILIPVNQKLNYIIWDESAVFKIR